MSETRRSPYQGLTPFDVADEPYFFGREKDARLICADLFAAPLSVLYGASGVGKSSVLRAGVVPLLRKTEDLMVVVFNAWQSDPVSGLKGAAIQALVAVRDDREVRDAIFDNDMAPLAKFLPMCAKLAKRRLMVILDQFEEHFLYQAQARLFAEQFPAAATLDDLSLSFMISLREDALAGLDRFEGKIPSLFDNLRRIDHLDVAAARDAIRKPLEQYALDHPGEPRITVDDDLVENVIEDVRANRLGFEGAGRGTEIETAATSSDRIEAPYLQLVMTRLWNDAQSRSLTKLELGTFNSLGRAKKIVDDHLEAVLGRLTDEERDAAARVFEYLVTPSGTKIAHTVRDLSLSAGIDAALLRTMMERLASGTERVLRPVAASQEAPDEPRYEIFHDRLAPAILAWRTAYVRNKELAESRLSEVGKRRAAAPIRSTSAPKARTSTGDPPYMLLADLLREGALTAVFGSGASLSARPKRLNWKPGRPNAPTAWELVQHFASAVDVPAEDFGPRGLAEAASYFAAMVGDNVLHRVLYELFSRVEEPAPIHKVIAKAAKRAPMLIVTSTFDTLVEQALDAEEVAYGVVANDLSRGDPEVIWYGPNNTIRRDHPKAVVVSPSQTWVYKLFGSVNRASTLSTFAITEEDEMELFMAYNRTQLPPPRLANQMISKRALFLGMGLGSWTQRLLISSLKPSRSTANELHGWSIARGISLLDSRRWKQAGIDVFDRDLNDVATKLGAAIES